MRFLFLAFLLSGFSFTGSALAASEGMLETEPGVRIFWRMIGAGDETLIIPGDFLFGGDMDFLAGSRRVVLYDMRNRGRSSRVGDPALLTLAGDVHDLEAIRRHAGADSFSTIGYSYLGKMVVLYALQHPERIERIVQIGPADMRFGSIVPRVYNNSVEDVMDPVALAAVRELRTRGFHESNPRQYCEREWLVTRVRLVGDPSRAEKLASHCEMENEWPVNFTVHLRHHFASVREMHVDPIDLDELEAPVLTVHGTLDRNAPYGSGREWAALIPDARLITVEGGAHQAWIDDPEVLRDISRFLEGAWPSRSEDLEIASEEWLSQLRGWELLKRAGGLAGMGEGVKTSSGPVRIEFSGSLYPRSQSERPFPPFTAFPVTDDVVLDVASKRIAARHEMRWPNFTSRVRMVGAGDDGFEVVGESTQAEPLGISPADLRLRYMRRMPPMLIDAALKAPSSIRLLGTRAVEEEKFILVSAEVEGSSLTLWFDKNDRLRRVTRLIEDDLLGDVLEETRYSEEPAETAPGLPQSVQVWFNGQLSAEVTVEGLGPATEEKTREVFELPASGIAAEAERAPVAIRQLAERVWLVTNIGGRDYRTLVIERDDSLLLGETPLNYEAMEAVLEILAERFPGKPVRAAVVTHHHFDHSGGVTAVMRNGATIVTAPGNAAFFREIASAPRTLEGASPLPPVQLEVVREDRKLLDGSGPAVEVHLIAAGGHAAEMLSLWLPKERILFQGDLFAYFPDSAGRARPQAISLLKTIEERALPVERIVGVHGEIATLEDLRAAVRRAEEGTPTGD